MTTTTDGHADFHAEWHALRCAVHLHTTFSDGDWPIQDVITAAAESGVDILLVTDHGQDQRAETEWEGYHDDLFVLMGSELASKSGDHLLVFGIHEKVAVGRLGTPDAVRLLDRLGALALIAHPQGRPRYYMFRRSHAWQRWDLREYHGLEVWSYMHDWIEGLTPGKLADMCREPSRFIDGPDAGVLAGWDQVAERRKIAGVGGLDAHGRHLPLGLSKRFDWAAEGILPYRQNFCDFSHYLLTRPLFGDKREDARLVQRAIKDCQGWIAHDDLHSGRDFRYYGTLDGKPFPLGTEIPLAPNITLHVEVPTTAEIRLLSRGETVAEVTGTTLNFTPEEPGEYRVEVRLGGRFWILSNHIYLRRPAFFLRGRG